jgi:Mn-containing catalase
MLERQICDLAMLLEQCGGANGELAAAMQYSIQGLNCDDPERKDLLIDIGTEELSHLEVVGTLARMHLKPLQIRPRCCREIDPLVAIAGGRSWIDRHPAIPDDA